MDIEQAVGDRDHREHSCELLLSGGLDVISYGPFYVRRRPETDRVFLIDTLGVEHDLDARDPSALREELDDLVDDHYANESHEV